MGSRIMQSMFLEKVSELEVLSIVNKCKNKTSTDSDGLDMTIIKRTIDCIVKPLTYICNLYIQTGLFKTRDKHKFNNYRPVSLLSQFSNILDKW